MKWYNFLQNESRWVAFTQRLFNTYEFNTHKEYAVIGCITKLYRNIVLNGIRFFPNKKDVYCEKRFNFTIYSKPKMSEIKMRGKGGFTPIEVIARIDFHYNDETISHYNIYRYKKENDLYVYNYYLDGFEVINIDKIYHKVFK